MINKDCLIIIIFFFLIFACGCKEDKSIGPRSGVIDLELKVLHYKHDITEDGVRYRFAFDFIIKNISDEPLFIYIEGDAFDDIWEHKGEKKKECRSLFIPDPDAVDHTCFIPLKAGESFHALCSGGGRLQDSGIYNITGIYMVPEAFKKWGKNVWTGQITSNTVSLDLRPPLISREISYLIKMSILALVLIIISIIIYRRIKRARKMGSNLE